MVYNSNYVLDRRFLPIQIADAPGSPAPDELVMNVKKSLRHGLYVDVATHPRNVSADIHSIYSDMHTVNQGHQMVVESGGLVEYKPDEDLYEIAFMSAYYKESDKTPSKCVSCNRNMDLSSRRPKGLQCGHVICGKCVTSLFDAVVGGVKCPMCDKLDSRTKSQINASNVPGGHLELKRAYTDFVINPIYLRLLSECTPRSLKARAVRSVGSNVACYVWSDETTDTMRKIGAIDCGKMLGCTSNPKDHSERFDIAKEYMHNLMVQMSGMKTNQVIAGINELTPLASVYFSASGRWHEFSSADRGNTATEDLSVRMTLYFEYLISLNRDFFESGDY
jgi:hypothetical protein